MELTAGIMSVAASKLALKIVQLDIMNAVLLVNNGKFRNLIPAHT